MLRTRFSLKSSRSTTTMCCTFYTTWYSGNTEPASNIQRTPFSLFPLTSFQKFSFPFHPHRHSVFHFFSRFPLHDSVRHLIMSYSNRSIHVFPHFGIVDVAATASAPVQHCCSCDACHWQCKDFPFRYYSSPALCSAKVVCRTNATLDWLLLPLFVREKFL